MNLIFDCDDTLYDCSWPFRMAVNELLPEKECDLTAFYKYYREIGDVYFPLLQQGKITTDESGVLRIKESAPKFGYVINDELAIQFQKTYKDYQMKISIHPELKEYLMNCDHRIAVLTNGDNEHQRRKLRALGVFEFVDEKYIYTSGEIGVSKPDRRVFEYVIDKWGGKPSDWFYIGDSYVNDMQGAKNAGLHTIYMNRHRNQEGDACDYIVYSDAQLLELLKTL